MPFKSLKLLGFMALLPAALFALLNLFRRNTITIGKYTIQIPNFKFFGSQMAVALLDWLVAGYILYILLPDSPHLSPLYLLGVFLLGQLAGLASQIPGGLGVFETVVVLLLSPVIPASAVIGSLLVYRGMYYILPLLAGALLLGTQELLSRKEALRKLTRYAATARRHRSQCPALTTFLGGAVLLFSGATPAEHTVLPGSRMLCRYPFSKHHTYWEVFPESVCSLSPGDCSAVSMRLTLLPYPCWAWVWSCPC